MRRHLLMLLCLSLLLVANTALAGKTVSVTRIDNPDPQVYTMGGATRSDCQVGNLNDPAWLIGDWVWGEEGYKYLFHPQTSCSCPIGFQLETIHMLMDFGVEDVPVTFEAYVDLEEAVWDDLLGCYYPGPETCVSPVYQFTIDTAGTYDIAMSIFDHCDCAYMNYNYFLSFHFVTTFDSAMLPSLVSDEFPVGCTSWNDYGFGWQDLVNDFGWPGELMMWADVVCCEFPVGTENGTWGEVKTMYR
ncbi:MAG: hypothetical protein ABIF77_11045 [bacterium]